MSEHGKSAAVITAIGAILAAAVGGYFAGSAESTVVVKLPDQQPVRFAPDEAADRIEKLSNELTDARETIQALTNKVNAETTSTAAPSARRPSPETTTYRDEGDAEITAKSSTAIEVDGFVFELEACSKQGGNLVCSFYVTNQGGDRTLQIIRGSRVVTADGLEYSAREKELGARRTRGTAGVDLVHGVRTKGALHFDGVPPLTGNLPLVEIKCWAPNGQFEVQFRSVPV